MYTSALRPEISWGGVRLGEKILTLSRKDEQAGAGASPLPCWKRGVMQRGTSTGRGALQQQPPGGDRAAGWGNLF